MVRSKKNPVLGIHELDLADCRLSQDPSSLSQGMVSTKCNTSICSDQSRPVIVAENMIGCAMYELVGRYSTLRARSSGLMRCQGPRRS